MEESGSSTAVLTNKAIISGSALDAVEMGASSFMSSCIIGVDVAKIIKKKHDDVYPNPFIDMINIDLDDDVQRVEVYNLLGKMVYRNDELTSNRISLSELKKGIYFLTIYSVDNKTFSEKIIKL